MQFDYATQATAPNIVAANKLESSCSVIDRTLLFFEKILEKQTEKAEKYQDKKMEVKVLWDLRNTHTVVGVGSR